jgi:hypothetical protein
MVVISRALFDDDRACCGDQVAVRALVAVERHLGQLVRPRIVVANELSRNQTLLQPCLAFVSRAD